MILMIDNVTNGNNGNNDIGYRHLPSQGKK